MDSTVQMEATLQVERQADVFGQMEVELILFDTDKPVDAETGKLPLKAVLRKRTKQTDRSREQQQGQTRVDTQVNTELTAKSGTQMQANRKEERKPPDGSGMLRFGIGAILIVIAAVGGWRVYKRIKK
jgi:hypothetical protein